MFRSKCREVKASALLKRLMASWDAVRLQEPNNNESPMESFKDHIFMTDVKMTVTTDNVQLGSATWGDSKQIIYRNVTPQMFAPHPDGSPFAEASLE